MNTTKIVQGHNSTGLYYMVQEHKS